MPNKEAIASGSRPTVRRARLTFRINVYGDHKREYFSCIRRKFFRIHAGFTKLCVTEWIPLPDNEDEAVTYGNLYGYWKAGWKEYRHGENRRSYAVSRLLDGIETEEERLAGILRSMDFKAKDIEGKTPRALKVFIQNISGEHAKGVQAGKTRDVSEKTDEITMGELFENISIEELTKVLERKKKG